MGYIIGTIFAIIFGVFFLSTGIRALKTNTTPFKKQLKDSIDQPRGVGVLFTYLGILALALAPNIFLSNPVLTPNDALAELFSNILFFVGFIGGSILMLTIVVIGMNKRTVFCLMETPKTKPLIKKYYRPINISAVVCSLSPIAMVTLNSLLPYEKYPVTQICFGILTISIVIICTLLCLIEIKSRKNKSKTQK